MAFAVVDAGSVAVLISQRRFINSSFVIVSRDFCRDYRRP